MGGKEARYDLRQSRKIYANLVADLRTSDLDVCYLIARKTFKVINFTRYYLLQS